MVMNINFMFSNKKKIDNRTFVRTLFLIFISGTIQLLLGMDVLSDFPDWQRGKLNNFAYHLYPTTISNKTSLYSRFIVA